MDSLLFPLGDKSTQSTQSTTLRLGISDKRHAELIEFVPRIVAKNIKEGTAGYLLLFAKEAKTVQEFGWMCKIFGEWSIQLVQRFPFLVPEEFKHQM